MRARAPASAANLGPGLDVLAVALDRYVEVEIDIDVTDRLTVRAQGEGAGMFEGAEHLAARVASGVCGHDRLDIVVRSQIPVARGLGSSAALAVAAAAAAGAGDPLGVAIAVDGHADNAAACVLGGLVIASGEGTTVRTARAMLDPEIAFVAVVPDVPLSTVAARAVLPQMVTREEAISNLGSLGLLMVGLADHRLLVPEATDDWLHQRYRAPLFPDAEQLRGALLDAGALAACWSGAGPTVLGITTSDRAPAIAGALSARLGGGRIGAEVMVLHPDMEGLVVGPGRTLFG